MLVTFLKDKDNRVASYSFGDVDSSILEKETLEISEEDLANLKKNYIVYLRNSALEFEPTPAQVEEQKVQERLKEIEGIKEKINTKISKGEQPNITEIYELLNKITL